MKPAWFNVLARHIPSTAGQSLLMSMVLVGVTTILLSIVYHGLFQHGLRHIEHADPQPIAFTIDLNEADWPELTLLPGIGRTLAQRIVALRDEQGPYRRIDDLLAVHGIGPKLLSNIQPHLVLRESLHENLVDASQAAPKSNRLMD
jgi:competence ComEA-like helix-hairpin-helix protein